VRATPPEPAGPLSCRALDYLETWAVPGVLGKLETHAMGLDGTLLPCPALPFTCFRSWPSPRSSHSLLTVAQGKGQCHPTPTWRQEVSAAIWDSCTNTGASPSQGSSLNWTNGVEEEFLE
jgi:hypothetical protein